MVTKLYTDPHLPLHLVAEDENNNLYIVPAAPYRDIKIKNEPLTTPWHGERSTLFAAPDYMQTAYNIPTHRSLDSVCAEAKRQAAELNASNTGLEQHPKKQHIPQT